MKAFEGSIEEKLKLNKDLNIIINLWNLLIYSCVAYSLCVRHMYTHRYKVEITAKKNIIIVHKPAILDM